MAGVRVRFAPSPTGYLHIGGARTALFNFLFARHNGGTFVLRIEDTDESRTLEGAVERICEGLRWLGITWDEGPHVGGEYGPYFQTQRAEIYQRALAEAVDRGVAYPCYCTPEELAVSRERQQRAGQAPRYEGTCRNLTPEQRAQREAEGRKPVLRLKVPQEGSLEVEDVIRGKVRFELATLDDFIIQKSNGMPTYNFAVVVDDHAMKITHVIRGEEHLSNTPKQALVYHALGYELPIFAHVPMILAPDRTKLSKRHGATAVEEYREMGILPEALRNYLLLLGFTPGDERELLDLDEMIALFELSKVNKNPAIYDNKKLIWMNSQYLSRLPVEHLFEEVRPWLEAAGLWSSNQVPDQQLFHQLDLARERAHTLPELVEAMRYFLSDDYPFDEKGVRKVLAHPGVAERLEQCADRIETLDAFTADKIEQSYRQLAEELGLPARDLIHPTRVAVTGTTVGPSLFHLLEALGREPTVTRLRRVAQQLRAQPSLLSKSDT